MSIEKGKISGFQLTFILTTLIHGSIFTAAFISDLAKHDSWIPILSGFAVIIPFAIIYASLAKMFPRMNLVQINCAIYGKYVGTAISLFYVFYFFMVLTFNLRQLADFYMVFFMQETPMNLFLIVFTLACAYALWKGIEVLARISTLFAVILFFVIISSVVLLIPKMDFSNFLPVFELPLANFFHSTHIIAAIPFGEIFIFLTFADTINNTEHIVKNVLIGLLLGVISLLLISVRDIAVLGNTYSTYSYPPLNSIRMIDIGNVLTKMDVLIGIAFTISLFYKSCLFYYATVTSLSQCLKLTTYYPLILPIGGIAAIIATTDWRSSVEFATVSPNVAPIFITPFLFIFPLLSLFIAKIRSFSN